MMKYKEGMEDVPKVSDKAKNLKMALMKAKMMKKAKKLAKK